MTQEEEKQQGGTTPVTSGVTGSQIAGGGASAVQPAKGYTLEDVQKILPEMAGGGGDSGLPGFTGDPGLAGENVDALGAGNSVGDVTKEELDALGPRKTGDEMLEDTENGANSGSALPSTATAPYLANWGSGISVRDAAKNAEGKTYLDVIRDRERWARETGGAPMDIFDFMALKDADLSKSVADNEAAEKKRRRQENWEKIGNLLAHVGGFVGALRGAPASTTLENPLELTKRQQALRDKTEALRRSDNQYVWNALMKERADARAAEIAKRNAEIAAAREARQKTVADSTVAKNSAVAAAYGQREERANRVADSTINKNTATVEAAGRREDRADRVAESVIAKNRAQAAKAASGGSGRGRSGGGRGNAGSTRVTSTMDPLTGKVKKTVVVTRPGVHQDVADKEINGTKTIKNVKWK